jgi:hypothetical protein
VRRDGVEVAVDDGHELVAREPLRLRDDAVGRWVGDEVVPIVSVES